MKQDARAADRWRLADAWVATLPVSIALQDRGSVRGERWAKAAVVALCVLLHAGFLALLCGKDDAMERSEAARPLVVEFIGRRPPPAPPPPMPRLARAEATRAHSTARIDPPPPARSRAEPVPVTDAAADLPTRRRLSYVPALAGSMRDENVLAPPDPMQPFGPRLPGSDVAIVEGISLRRQITPEDVVKAIGSVFGGGYEPCPDLQAKVHDATISQPHRYSDAERRALIERERHCRYR
jgi:hypothetical protein